MTTTLFWIPVGLYLVGWLAEFFGYWSEGGRRLRWSRGVLGIGWGAHSFLLISLAVQEGLGLAVLLIAAGWVAILLYYGWMQRRPSAVLPFVGPPFASALLITAFFASERVLVGPESLGLTVSGARNLLMAHISSVLGGSLLFGVACVVSIVYLVQEHRLKAKRTVFAASRLPSLGALENYNHKAIILGFFLMTVGLLLGLIVAGVNTLPHRLFSARQVVPTLVWLVYAIFLLAYDLQGRRGRFGARWSIVGFAVVVAALVSEIVFLIGRA